MPDASSRAPSALRRATAWLNDRPWLYLVPVWIVVLLVYGSVEWGSPWARSALLGGLIGLTSAGVSSCRSRSEARASGVSLPELAVFETQLRRGEVPDRAQDREAMRALVTRRRSRMRNRKRVVAVFFVLLAGIGVASLWGMELPYSVLALLLWCVLAVLFVTENRRLRARLDRMHRALAADPPRAPRT
ncbi:hypothetical protein [Streptomyces candidus]|uniref:Uncharacterized protein n=1 Tax=Streptomyces candidus TaxID=67283 RepID=A0A7X0HB84_9ACTN|nr:hypothetical protein [Streptomyces candidus]MBB6434360.1 hypothetical protein [Streptomyces candidus]GHH36949.1 hypothetical protein GCM10018773_12980 [Streptomyces candidus]